MAEHQHGKFMRNRPLLLGVVFMLVLVAAIYMAYNATSGMPGTEQTHVRASFDHAGELLVDDDVRIGQLRVGRVSEIKFRRGKAIVTLELKGGRQVYNNAKIGIGNEKPETKGAIHDRSALGQKYVDLYPGTPNSGRLSDGAIVPASQTQDSQNLDKLFNVFDPPTRRALGSTLRETGHGFSGHAGDFHDVLRSAPSVLADLGTVSRAVYGEDGRSFTAMLQSADALAKRFAGREERIERLTDQTARTLNLINVDKGAALAGSLERAPEALRKGGTALEKVQLPLRTLRFASEKLRPGALALGDATPDLRGVLRESPLPLDKVPGVAKQAEPALNHLSNVMSDARPLVPRASRALANVNPFVAVLSPYAPEIGLAFDNMASALAHGPNDGTATEGTGGRYLRIHLLVAPENVDGQLGLKDPLVPRNAYPEPGQAQHDKIGSGPANPIRNEGGR